jgi:hypothetical protein
MNRIIFLVALIFLLMVAGCSKDEAMPVSVEPVDEEKTAENDKKDEVDEPQYSNVYPLSGIETNDEVNQRTIAVMINNHPKARQQSGLHKADLVYEVLAEGNVTRFLAIFQSEIPANMGPVRSARDYYVELSKGYDAFYVAHGYSPDARQMLEAGEIDNINGMVYDGTLFQRADFRSAPHNSYITFDNVMKGAVENGYATTHDSKPLVFLTDEEVEAIDGEVANKVMVSYSKSDFSIVEYVYNEELQRYYRYSDDERTEDLDSKAPVLIDNILIVETSHKVIDDAGRRDIDLTSGGKAYLLQKGKKQEVEWKNVNGRIIPFLNEAPVGLVPGKTWINIVPSLGDVTDSETTN